MGAGTGGTNPLYKPQEQGKRVPSYKKGGRVKKTGHARVHKGEQVIPARKAEKARKARKPLVAKRAARRSGR